MQKKNYLHYFSKGKSSKKKTDQSLKNNFSMVEPILQNSSFEHQSNRLQNCPETCQQNFGKNSNFINQKRNIKKKLSDKNFSSQKLKKFQNFGSPQDQNQQKSSFKENRVHQICETQQRKSLNQQNLQENQFHKNGPKQQNHHRNLSRSLREFKPLNKIQKRTLTLQSQPLNTIGPYNRNKTAKNKKFKTKKTTFGDLNSSCKNYNDFYTINLQNRRMAWRILNTKSMIEEYLHNMYFTYQIYNGKLVNKDKFCQSLKKHNQTNLSEQQKQNVLKAFLNNHSNSNKSHLSHQFHQNIFNRQNGIFQKKKKLKKENIEEPSFFKDTYFLPDRSFNKRICKTIH